MDDLMKAIMAKANQEIVIAKKKEQATRQAVSTEHHLDAKKVETVEHHADAKKVETKPEKTVYVVQPKSEPAPMQEKPKIVEQPTWSAETQQTIILPSMLEPQTPEPVKEAEHQVDSNLEDRSEFTRAGSTPTPEIEVMQPKVDPSIKLFVGVGGGFFGVALLAAIYTALTVSGVM